MKKVEWINGNKMLIETGHKTFDRQTNIICRANGIANTMSGFYIRSWWDDGEGLVDYKTNKRESGYLYRYDLRQFGNIPTYIRQRLEFYAKESKNSIILYSFYHYNGDRKITHGWAVTDNKYHLLQKWVTGSTYKSWDVMVECVKYISN